jgi:hypothetical protein
MQLNCRVFRARTAAVYRKTVFRDFTLYILQVRIDISEKRFGSIFRIRTFLDRCRNDSGKEVARLLKYIASNVTHNGHYLK